MNAVDQIRQAHAGGVYAGREHRNEPPYMAPSDDPESYSMVCAFGSLPHGLS
jgi:hypothetical protein